MVRPPQGVAPALAAPGPAPPAPLSRAVERQLLAISSRQIDRRLAPDKRQLQVVASRGFRVPLFWWLHPSSRHGKSEEGARAVSRRPVAVAEPASPVPGQVGSNNDVPESARALSEARQSRSASAGTAALGRHRWHQDGTTGPKCASHR